MTAYENLDDALADPHDCTELDLVGLGEFPVAIGILTRLVRLSITYSELPSIPPEIAGLQQLESLVLDGVRGLRELPDELFALPSLSRLSLDRSPTLLKRYGGNKLVPLLAELTAAETPGRRRVIWVGLLTNRVVPGATAEDLLDALACKTAQVRRAALAGLATLLPAAEFPSGAKLATIGTVSATARPLIAELRTRGVSIARAIDPVTTHVLVGDAPGPDLATARTRRLGVLVEDHVARWLAATPSTAGPRSSVSETELLGHVLRAPADDAPRSIFADWLLERGDPRGEFIQVQCALASMPDDDPRRAGLAVRENELLRDHREAWTAPYRKWQAQVHFRRGFVDEIVIRAGVFAREADAITRLGPLRAVHGQGITNLDDMRAFVAALRGIREVRIATSRRLGPGQVALLVDSEHTFEQLSLRECWIGETGLTRVLASTRLGSLEMLDLAGNGIEPSGVERLARTATLPALRRLALGGNGFGPRGISGLLGDGDPVPAKLVELSLGGSAAGHQGTTLLAASKALPALRRLDLSHNEIDDRPMAALAAATRGSALEVLDLRGNRITDRGARAFLTSRPLRDLRLEDNALSPMLLAELETRGRAPRSPPRR